jgi:hypothetical protein
MTIIDNTVVPGVFGSVRDQGARPTCLAFAMSDLSKFHADCDVLSAEYLYRGAALQTIGWQPGDGTYLSQAIAVAKGVGLPHETTFPYQLAEPVLPIPVLPVGSPETHFKTTFSSLGILPATDIAARVAAGKPVGMIIKLTQEFFLAAGGIVPFSPLVLPDERHAVIAVPNCESAKPGYTRIRNSWGNAWGDAGHAWLHNDYVNTHTVATFGV